MTSNLRRQWPIRDTIVASFPLLTSTLTHVKLILFIRQRGPYERLLRITNATLWMESFTDHGKIVLKNCEQQAKLFLFIFVILGHASGAGWIFEPLILNMKANSSAPDDRHLPTEVIVGVPLFESPNYEIIFAIDVLGVYIITILYFCFDYYLVLVNIFIAGQFEILKRRFATIYSVKSVQLMRESQKNMQNGPINDIFKEFKDCVMQHQFLIFIVDEIESIYNFMNLVEVIMISLIICLVSYPLLMPGSALTVVKNGVFVCSCLVQLFTFILSCHNIMVSSSDLSNGIYFSRWYENYQDIGRSLSTSFMIVFVRTQCPCYITAWGFFPITMDTLKSIITTSFSYLTLMRQSME
ncbi:odorant receptor 83a isoform X2 [Fopius arisanus]|uniref:Odorant receptor n=2 Tax=Fopius arisanus TaxID=64838 RepID=A0A9R1T685_9HYME|nr:PREDICTED: odorant receptor 83a-like isoform X2 [Fopius arisanus]